MFHVNACALLHQIGTIFHDSHVSPAMATAKPLVMPMRRPVRDSVKIEMVSLSRPQTASPVGIAAVASAPRVVTRNSNVDASSWPREFTPVELAAQLQHGRLHQVSFAVSIPYGQLVFSGFVCMVCC